MGASQSSFRPSGAVLPGSYLGELGTDIQYEKRCCCYAAGSQMLWKLTGKLRCYTAWDPHGS